MNERDCEFAEGVRRSAEFMRVHEDEPNEYRPSVHHCAECEHPCSDDFIGPDEGFRCAGQCGNWMCAAHKGYCEQCRIDREEAVAAEAARLETEIEQRKEALLRTMNV